MPCTINASTSAGLVSTASTDGSLALQTNSGVTALTIDTSQRVLIGTTSTPTGGGVNLDIVGKGSNDGGIQITAGTGQSGGGIAIISNATGGGKFYSFTGNTGSETYTERMRIDSSGNVGIGTTSPNTKFEVNGQIRSSGSTARAMYIYGAATVKPYITINEYGVRDWDVGAGYYSSGTFSIQSGNVNGVYLGGTATSWASASDERIKDIIEPISNAITKVNSLRSVIGKYKTDEEGVRRSFLIAQDIQTHFPEALESSDQDKLGVQYTDVIPLLVAAIKELKAIVDSIQSEFDAYKATHP